MEKQTLADENDKATGSISIIRELLNDESFKDEHRTVYNFFTRKYAFPFVAVLKDNFTCIASNRYSLFLPEFFKKRDNGILVTKSAFTQARRHLKHEAFITLNQRAVLDVLYADDNFENAWGFRLLAIDGSKIHLPNTPEINEEFGTINFTNVLNKNIIGQHGYGLISVMYDVLNKIVILAVLAPAKAYEVDLALEHIKHTLSGRLDFV